MLSGAFEEMTGSEPLGSQSCRWQNQVIERRLLCGSFAHLGLATVLLLLLLLQTTTLTRRRPKTKEKPESEPNR